MTSPKNPRGMMMVIAIVLLGLISVTLATLTQQMGSAANRLHQQTDSAQAHQILIAATHSLLTNPDTKIILPPQLLQAGSSLKISPLPSQPNQKLFRLDALSHHIHLTETLTLSSTPTGWSITTIQLQ